MTIPTGCSLVTSGRLDHKEGLPHGQGQARTGGVRDVDGASVLKRNKIGLRRD
jgi:hypothetical protein